MSYSRESARAALAAWRRTDKPVTAVAAFNDLTALAVLAACHTEGVRIPGDLAVVGVDDLPAAAVAVPALSTISMDLSIPGRKLAERVIGMIEASEPAVEYDEKPVLHLIHRRTS
jgi:DNA-binding LacI/PurR family transcriptional regulator